MIFKNGSRRFGLTCVLVSMLSLSSCYPIANWTHGLADDIDPGVGLSRGEFKKELLQQPPESDAKDKPATAEKKDTTPAIPEYSDILATPPAEDIPSDKLVSLTVTEDVPIKDVLIELSRLADVDMEIDPGISGGIIFRVKDKPFKDVIKRICELAGLRYHNEHGMLHVERDTPYLVNYTVDFLNMVRSSSSNVSIDTKVLGNSGNTGNNNTTNAANNTNRTSTTNTNRTNTPTTNSGASGGNGLSSGSTNSITSSYEGDLWTSIESTIQSILAFKPGNLSLQGAGDSAPAVSNTSYNINKQAGVISVLATQRQHHNISNYLDNVRKSASAQVLIEAKIVEVTLNEEYRSGIDWGTLSNNGPGVQLSGALPTFTTGLDKSAPDIIKIARLDKTNSLSSSVGLMDTFGVTRTLSSPRLHAINNQQAVLTFAENEVYFTLQVEEQKDNAADGKTTLTVNSVLNSVPIGVILALQPSINLDTQEITMNVRPTLSRVTGSVSDPGVDIIVARNPSSTGSTPIKSQIPVVEVRELDSILKIKSGEVMVIGGLMKQVNSNTDKGIPGAGRLPMLGNFFKSVDKKDDIVETVIFIKATIIPSSGSTVPEADQHMYKTFTRDPRPLAF